MCVYSLVCVNMYMCAALMSLHLYLSIHMCVFILASIPKSTSQQVSVRPKHVHAYTCVWALTVGSQDAEGGEVEAVAQRRG